MVRRAVGTLLTITSTRRRHLYAWIGIAALVVQTVIWGGPGLLLTIGAVGSIAWVAVSHILSRALLKASADAARFARAEREATDWQAAQEAHLYERQFRLGQTGTVAVPMLRIIEQSKGELTDAQRQECLHLEGAIRDEIRGRRLLDEDVRREVMAARRRGVAVTLFDEGGLDDLDDASLARVLSTLAEAIRSTSATRVIARTAPADSETAVTVAASRRPTRGERVNSASMTRMMRTTRSTCGWRFRGRSATPSGRANPPRGEDPRNDRRAGVPISGPSSCFEGVLQPECRAPSPPNHSTATRAVTVTGGGPLMGLT